MNTTSTPSKKRTHGFLEGLARETKVLKGTTRMELAMKLNEKTKLLIKKSKQQERISNRTRQLESIEVQIEIVKGDIQNLRTLEKEGSPDDDD